MSDDVQRADKIALIGGREAGKTSLMAAINAEFNALKPFARDTVEDIISELGDEIEEKREEYELMAAVIEAARLPENNGILIDEGKSALVEAKRTELDVLTRRHALYKKTTLATPSEYRDTLVNFYILGYPDPNDGAFIEALREDFRRKPIKFPPPTMTLPEVFRFDANFVVKSQANNKQGENIRRLALVDVAGRYLDPTNPDTGNLAKAKEDLLSCSTFIIFVDMASILSGHSNEAEHVVEYIRDIVAEAAVRAKKAGGPERLIPIALVFSKFDLVSQENQAKTFDRLFKSLALYLSEHNSNMLVMACPISIMNPRTGLLRDYNLKYPFLFTAMGVIMARAFEAAQLAEAEAAKASKAKEETQTARERARAAELEALKASQHADALESSGFLRRSWFWLKGDIQRAKRDVSDSWYEASLKAESAKNRAKEAEMYERRYSGAQREHLSEQQLASSIYQYLCVEEEYPENYIRFACGGRRIPLTAVSGYV